MYRIDINVEQEFIDKKQSGDHAIHINVKTGSREDVVVAGKKLLCKAVVPSARPSCLVLIFDTAVGIRFNGKAVFVPVVVIGQAGGKIVVRRAGDKTLLKVTYSPDRSVQTDLSLNRRCSLCHDAAGQGEIRRCPSCGRSYHAECLGPVDHNQRCPACQKKVGKSWEVSTQQDSQSQLGATLPDGDGKVSRRYLKMLCQAEPTVAVVGCGNIGSKLALQLPAIGIRRVVLIDSDRICVERNGKCCPLFASGPLEGRSKVDVLAVEIRRRNPAINVISICSQLREIGVEELSKFMPGILVGAVDSRLSRLDLSEIAQKLNAPLIDLAISSSSDWLIARVRTTWTSVNGISPNALWTVSDWQVLDDKISCGSGSTNDEKERPVASGISGYLAAVLCMAQIKKLLAGDTSDVGWETRINLNASRLIRCRLPKTVDESCNHQPIPEASTRKQFAARRAHRIMNDKAALAKLANANSDFTFRQIGSNVFLFEYVNTPGLIRTNEGVGICSSWRVVVSLPERYPLEAPVVIILPHRQQGQTFHSNVRATSPQFLCYGKFVPVLLLDELARRIERILNLVPEAVMLDERDSLNPAACRYIRMLARERHIPLNTNIRLPELVR